MSDIDFRGARKERAQQTQRRRRVWVKMLLNTEFDDDGISERLVANLDASDNLFGIGHVEKAKFTEKKGRKKK